MKKITRTFLEHSVDIGLVKIVDGTPIIEHIGTYTLFNEPFKEAKVLKRAAKDFGPGSYIVTGVGTKEIGYQMDVVDFIKHAEIINK